MSQIKMADRPVTVISLSKEEVESGILDRVFKQLHDGVGQVQRDHAFVSRIAEHSIAVSIDMAEAHPNGKIDQFEEEYCVLYLNRAANFILSTGEWQPKEIARISSFPKNPWRSYTIPYFGTDR